MEYSKVGKYYEVFSGYAFKSQDLKETADIPIIKIGNISNGRNVINENMQFVSKELLGINKKYYVNRGDVLLSLTGSHMNQPNSVVGRSCRNYSDRLYLLNQRAGKIVPKNNASLSYIYYVLQTQAMKEMICCRAYGAANQVNVSPKSIMSIKWNFPSSDVQHSIASILSTYDILIENNTKRIRLLEKMAENLYKEWFVRFRFLGHENVEMENGLPKGWKVKKYEDEFNVKYGKGLPTDKLTKDGFPVFGSNGQIGYYTSYMYETPQILISCRGASSGVVNISLPKSFITNNSLICEMTNKTESVFEYLKYCFLNTNLVQYQTGSAQPQITINNIVKLKLLIPSTDVQIKFADKVRTLDKEVGNLQHQNSLLARQRDLLLPRLMSGKLEVKEELLE